MDRRSGSNIRERWAGRNQTLEMPEPRAALSSGCAHVYRFELSPLFPTNIRSVITVIRPVFCFSYRLRRRDSIAASRTPGNAGVGKLPHADQASNGARRQALMLECFGLSSGRGSAW